MLLAATLQIFAAVIGVSILFTPLATNAQQTVPYLINFQGKLTDNSGNILPDGSYNMKFRLFNAPTSGTNEWEADRVYGTHDYRVTVQNGLFNIQFGDTTEGDTALTAAEFDSFTTSGGLYLEVELPTPATATCATNGCAVWTEGAMTPRQPLASSPYAINSDNLGGLGADAFGQISSANTWSATNSFTPSSGVAITIEPAASTNGLVVENSSGATEAYFDQNGILNVAQTIQATTSTANLGTSGTPFGTGYFNTAVQSPALNATSSGGTITTNAGTIQNPSSTGMIIDLKNSANTTLTVTNSGTGVAGISVDGGLTIGTSQTYNVGSSTGEGATCSGSQVLSGVVVTGGVVTGGTCVAAGGGQQLIGTWTSDQATTATGTQTTVQFTGAANSAPSFNNSTHVLTLPSNASGITVNAKGGGGGGGGVGVASHIDEAGGGGEGGISTSYLTSSLAANYYFQVGAAGAAGAATGGTGSPGGNSCFGTNSSNACTSLQITEAAGGAGGTGVNAVTGANGGAGGAATSGFGDVTLTGSPGLASTDETDAEVSGAGGGEGGGLASYAAVGANGANGTSGGGGAGAGKDPASVTGFTGGSGGIGYLSISVYITTAGTGNPATLQTAYTNSTNPATINLSDGDNLVVNAAQTATTDPDILNNLQCTSSCGANGVFAVQESGVNALVVTPDGAAGGASIGLDENTALASGDNLSLSGSGNIIQTFSSNVADSAQQYSITNSNSAAAGVAVQGVNITPINSTPTSGINTVNGLSFESSTGSAPGASVVTNGISFNASTNTTYTNFIFTPSAVLSATGAWTGLTGVTLQSGNVTTPGNISTTSSGTITSAGAITGPTSSTINGLSINAGALSTITSLSLSGAISGGTTITGTSINGTTGINTGAGTGTIRVDNSGDLENIGTISSSASLASGTAVSHAVTASGTSGTNTVTGINVALSGTANGTGSNAVTGLNFASPATATNNTFTAQNFATGYTNDLTYGGSTVIINGTGQLNGAQLQSATVANGSLADSSISTGLTGLTGSATVSLGGTLTLATAYGSAANTAVEGNDTLTCATTSGNLSGGGSSVTLGANGNCGALTLSSSPSFSGQLTLSGSGTNAVPILNFTGAPLGGATGATNSLVQLAGQISGGNVAANGGTYLGVNLPASGAGSAADFLNFQKANTVEFKVDNSGDGTFGGNLSIGSGDTYEIGGTQISSANLSNSSSITTQGNTFNGATELVETNASTQLPAISGNLLTNLNPTNLVQGSGAVTLQSAAATAVNITSNAAATWSTSTGLLTVQSGTGQISLGSSTSLTANAALTVESTGANALTLATQTSGANVDISPNGTGTVVIGGTTPTVTSAGGITLQAGGTAQNVLLTPSTSGTVVVGGTTPTITTSGATALAIDTGAAAALTLGGTNANAVNIANQSTNAATVGIANNGTAHTTTIGSTAGGTTKLQAGNTAQTITTSGDSIQTNTTNSTTAFQVQNAAAQAILGVDTLDDNTNNLLVNPSIESAIAGNWAAKNGSGASTVTQVAAPVYDGAHSLQIVTTGTATNAGTSQSIALANNTVYDLSVYVSSLNGLVTPAGAGAFNMGYGSGGADTACLTSAKPTANSWTRFTCSFTTGTLGTAPYIYFDQSDATGRTFYIDAADLETDANATSVWQDGQVNLNATITGPLVISPNADSTNTLDVQNSNGVNVLQVGTADTNLIANPGLEVNSTGWSFTNTQSSTNGIFRDTSTSYLGVASLKLVTTATATDEAKYTFSPSTLIQASTTYTLSFFAKLSTGTLATLTFGREENGTPTSCVTTGALTTSWTRYSCTFAVGATIGAAPFIYIGPGTASQTMWIDAVSLEPGSTATPYGAGTIYFDGVITSPTNFQNSNDSTQAFTIQNAAGTSNLFVADTIDSRIGIGTATPTTALQVNGTVTATTFAGSGASLTNLNPTDLVQGTGAVTLEGASASNVVVEAAGTGTLTLESGTGNQVSLGTSTSLTATGALTVESTGSNALTLATQTSGANVDISPNGTGTVVIGGTTPTLTSTTAITLAAGGTAQNVNINPTTSGTVVIGGTTPTLSSAGSVTLQAGGTAQNVLLTPSTSGTVVVGGTAPEVITAGATALKVDTGAGAAINIGPTNATSIVVGGNTAATIKDEVANSSATAYTLQTAGGTDILVANTTGNELYVGLPTGSTTPPLLVFGNKTSTGDPTGVAGAEYYNSTNNVFRCAQGGTTFVDCISPYNESTTTQTVTDTTAYLAGSNIASPGAGLKVGSHFAWQIALTKTNVGTDPASFSVRLGTTGSDTDAAVATFTGNAGTAAADTGTLVITATVDTLSATTGTVQVSFTFTHNLAATGFNTVQTETTSVTDATADDNVAGDILGVSCTNTGGTGTAAFTFQQVQSNGYGL